MKYIHTFINPVVLICHHFSVWWRNAWIKRGNFYCVINLMKDTVCTNDSFGYDEKSCAIFIKLSVFQASEPWRTCLDMPAVSVDNQGNTSNYCKSKVTLKQQGFFLQWRDKKVIINVIHILICWGCSQWWTLWCTPSSFTMGVSHCDVVMLSLERRFCLHMPLT